MSRNNILGYFEGPAAQFTYHNPWLAEKTKGIGNFFNEIGTGFKNVWYSLTGQTEKTSAYQAQMARRLCSYSPGGSSGTGRPF